MPSLDFCRDDLMPVVLSPQQPIDFRSIKFAPIQLLVPRWRRDLGHPAERRR
jgi:hypothetical protein